jgi:hypothetical protein
VVLERLSKIRIKSFTATVAEKYSILLHLNAVLSLILKDTHFSVDTPKSVRGVRLGVWRVLEASLILPYLLSWRKRRCNIFSCCRTSYRLFCKLGISYPFKPSFHRLSMQVLPKTFLLQQESMVPTQNSETQFCYDSILSVQML